MLDGELQVITAKNLSISGNTIFWEDDALIEYGRWYIGTWIYEIDYILVDLGDGSYGSAGKATRIYSQGTATRYVWKFYLEATIVDGDLHLKYRSMGYYCDYNRVLFTQGDNSLRSYGVYTNW